MKLVEAYRAIFNGGNDLKSTERSVLLAYCYVVGECGCPWPADKRIAEMVGANERTIKRTKQKLRERGALAWDERPGMPSTYKVDLSALPVHKWAEYGCVVCGATDNLTTDHIIPKSRGGTDDNGNLRTLCRRCNCSKGSKLDSEWFGYNNG